MYRVCGCVCACACVCACVCATPEIIIICEMIYQTKPPLPGRKAKGDADERGGGEARSGGGGGAGLCTRCAELPQWRRGAGGRLLMGSLFPTK